MVRSQKFTEVIHRSNEATIRSSGIMNTAKNFKKESIIYQKYKKKRGKS